MWKAVAITLAVGALNVLAPMVCAGADPATDPACPPGQAQDPAAATYTCQVRAAVDQFRGDGMDQQQFIDQITAAGNQLSDALLARGQ